MGTPERWAFALLFVSTFTYTFTDIARRLTHTNAGPRPNPAIDVRSSRVSHARPMTRKERNARRASHGG